MKGSTRKSEIGHEYLAPYSVCTYARSTPLCIHQTMYLYTIYIAMPSISWIGTVMITVRGMLIGATHGLHRETTHRSIK